MGWPIKSGAVAAPIITHHSPTFTGISDEGEATALIGSTPLAQSVILFSGFQQVIWEDGTGSDEVEGCALRQINDTNVGLYVQNESGNVQNLTLKFSTLTFSQNVIKSLVHYVASADPTDSSEDWADVLIPLTTPVDPAKAVIFSGIIGGNHWPRDPGGGNDMRSGHFYLDPGDGANARLRYQMGSAVADNIRATFSVLEFK